MILLEETEYIRNNTTDKSILTKDDYQFFEKKLFKDNGKTFLKYLNDSSIRTMYFDRGIVMFKVFDMDYEGYNSDRICLILALCKRKHSKVNWKELLKGFWNFLRKNKCTKVKMYTKLDPKIWENNYGFKIKEYVMERNL